MSATKTTTEPWLTLAILVHNPSKDYLNALLDSIASQQGSFVVDVVDDSPQPVDYLASKNLPGYRYLRHANNSNGLSGNWNYAVNNARTQWVTVLHQDDILKPNYVALIESMTQSSVKATAVFCDADIVNERGEPAFSLADKVKKHLLKPFNEPFELFGQEGVAALLRGNVIFCPAVCFNREKLNEQRFDPKWRMVPDLELYLRLLMNGHVLTGTKHVGMLYRRHNEQATSAYQSSGLRFDEEFMLYKQVAAKCRSRGWLNAAAEGEKARMLKLHVCKELLVRLLKGQFRQAWRLRGYLRASGTHASKY